VQVLSLRALRNVLAMARAAGRWSEPAVVHVGTRELELLVDTLFAPPDRSPGYG
jgi:hypothetical protein